MGFVVVLGTGGWVLFSTFDSYIPKRQFPL